MIKRWWWVLLVMLVVGPLVGLFGAAAVSYVMPKKYESVATVAFAPDGKVEQHAVALKGDAVLRQVSAGLELPLKWNLDAEDTMEILRRLVATETIRGTDLVEIRVRHTSPGDAREIASGVVKAYAEAPAGQSLSVISEPVEGRIPVSPNINLNFAVGFALGLLLALPFGFMLIAILHRLVPPKETGPPPLPAA